MKRTISVLTFATLAATFSAQAAVIGASFTGDVYRTQGATGEAIGSIVAGHFDLDSTTGNYLDFTIAGQPVAAGYQSFASIGPAESDALYTAQVSPLSTGASSNSTFSLDLSSLTSWPQADTAFTLLADKNQLTTNLDTANNPLSAFPSSFSYYTANANGTNIVALNANLTSLTTTVTPEPASLALIVPSLLALSFFVRRRRADSSF